MLMRLVAALLCITVSIAAACDFEALATDCSPPTGTEDATFCEQHAAYKKCAADAKCTTIGSVSKVLESGRYRVACQGGSTARRSRSNEPRITTSGGDLHLNGKQVCFSEEGFERKAVCASELALKSQVQEVLAKLTAQQGVFSKTLTDTRDEMGEIVDTTLKPLKAQLEAANTLAAAQSETIKSIKEELDGQCGKHCFPGQFVKTPCTETTKTACADCKDGFFSPGGLNRFCPKCTVCSERQFKTTDCSRTEDTGCTDCTRCPVGKYAPEKDGKTCANTGTGHCAAHAKCSKTQWLNKAGTPWDNTICNECTKCGADDITVKTCDAKSDAVCSKCTKCSGSQPQQISECTAAKDTVCIAKQPSCRALQKAGATVDGMYELSIGYTYCIVDKKIGGGGWNLAINIHPNDKHSAAWAAKNPNFKPGGYNPVSANKPTFWAGDVNYIPKGAGKVPWGADYKSKPNNKVPVKEIMVVRLKNQKGAVLSNEGNQHFMWRRWVVRDNLSGRSLQYLYRNTYRTYVTHGVVEEAHNGNPTKGCPMFQYGGDLIMNFYYSNNGARLLLSGQSLSGEGQNDDSSFGLGMEFASHQGNRRFSGANGDWCFDASYAESPSGSSNAQGNDSCRNLRRNNNYLGEYAIFVR